MAEATSLEDRAVLGPTGSVRAMVRKSVAGFATAAAVVGMAGCSSGLSARSSTSGRPSPTTTPSTTATSSTTRTLITTTTTSSGSDGATQAAVLNAWESAQQTLYGYQQQPWQRDRANLVAGETSADLWPKLANYFTGAALQTQINFLLKTKMGEVSGPTTYDLGHSTVSALTATIAIVTGCIYDTGTTTASGQPAPSNLGGGAGSYSGTWNLQLVSATWKIASFQTTTVSKC